MPDFTLGEIAEKIGGRLHGDPSIVIHRPAEIAKAAAGDITFLANAKYKSMLENTSASAVIIDAEAGYEPAIPYIIAPNAYYGFLQAFLLYNPPQPLVKPGIHPTAVIEESAVLGEDVAIGANVYIGDGVTIGKNTQVMANVVILSNTTVGEDCLFYPLASIRENCLIGNRVILHNGAVIGSDGFGFAPWQGKYHKIPQVGTVILEDDVEIGANSTIDRATMGETIVRAGVKLDNLIHIAHNVTIGEHTVMAAQSGISGSTQIGRHCMIGGQVGTVGHIRIGDKVNIGAQSGVAKSVADNEVIFGSPARPIMHTKRIEAVINNLPSISRRLRALEKKMEETGEADLG